MMTPREKQFAPPGEGGANQIADHQGGGIELEGITAPRQSASGQPFTSLDPLACGDEWGPANNKHNYQNNDKDKSDGRLLLLPLSWLFALKGGTPSNDGEKQ